MTWALARDGQPGSARMVGLHLVVLAALMLHPNVATIAASSTIVATDDSSGLMREADALAAYEEQLRNPPVPTNYSVNSVTPRRVPVLGTGADARPQMLTVTGKNFSSLAGLPLYCWLSESNCGWHWTLVMNYLNTTARLINDTTIECHAPPFPLGGRATLSIFPDRPYHRVNSSSPGLRAARFAAPAHADGSWRAGPRVGINQPIPTAESPPGYNAKMAACVTQDLSVADTLSYEGFTNPWAEPLSVSVEYIPLLTMATARFPYTTGSPADILLTVAPEIKSDVATDLRVTIVLLATDGLANLTLITDAHVEAGRTNRVSFNLSTIAGRWEKALTNATAVLSGIVGNNTVRSSIASTYCRFLFAGPPIPTQIVTDHESGTLLGDGDTRISVQGWYEFSTTRHAHHCISCCSPRAGFGAQVSGMVEVSE